MPAVAKDTVAGGMDDYHQIRNSHNDRRLTPEETVAWHNESVNKLIDFLEAGGPETARGSPQLRVHPVHSCAVSGLPSRPGVRL